MKKLIALVLASICLIALVSCNIGDNEQSQNNAKPAYFVGEVIEIYDTGCLLKVSNEGNYGHLATGTAVQITADIENCPEYEIGDFLKVTFDGAISKSNPPQVLHVISIEKTDSAGNKKINTKN